MTAHVGALSGLLKSIVSVIVKGSGGAAAAAGAPNATSAPVATQVPISVFILVITPPMVALDWNIPPDVPGRQGSRRAEGRARPFNDQVEIS